MSYKKEVYIKGMHCASCEVLVERQFKSVPGVEKVSVNAATGKAVLDCNCPVSLEQLNATVNADGYAVSDQIVQSASTGKWWETGAIFAIVLGVYLLLKRFQVIPDIGVTDSMSYGVVFVIGLVAAVSSCMSVTGGLLLAAAAKFNELNPNLTRAQKFKPHIWFNLGRIISYTVLGGVVGALGSVLTLSPRVGGVVTIVVSLIMILLGFQLLNIFPGLQRFYPKMPKFIAHRLQDMTGKAGSRTAFVLGAGTFFLPCGFTQALQFYVLSQGNWWTGALIMLVFTLGTLPALLSLSVVSTFAKGGAYRMFMKVAGTMVVLLGVANIANGWELVGVTGGAAADVEDGVSVVTATSRDPNVTIVDGKQVVNMKVNGYEYLPSQFTIQKGVPVEWHIDGRGAAGCGRVLVMATLGVTKMLSSSGETVIKFTPKSTGKIPFNCSMGMMTPGAQFTVVD